VNTLSAPPFEPWAPASTSVWLSFSGDNKQRFQLRDNTSIALLELQIKAAMRNGEAISVDLQPEDVAKDRKVILNPHALPYVILTDGE
jgi:hypothetical protein